ncbi:type II toxin-antitoxin system RelE/ParE family toxin [Candidatus Woesearchaeota archaeon]|nr:type II toxin-antitoxin system RelE/ParE family toxin [Candidatus Woesearchaeota archaeon]
MYEIIITEKAEKQLKKLERSIQNRVLAVLERVRIRPEAFFQRLVGEKAYKLRIGDYRAIADIERNSIIILKIGHRKNIY